MSGVNTVGVGGVGVARAYFNVPEMKNVPGD